MRLDRLISLGLVNPVSRIVANFTPRFLLPATRSTLPILMYHSISDDPESRLSPYYKNCTSSQRFAGHMAWLAAAGYRGVTLSEGLAALQAQSAQRDEPSPPAKLVAITFDDGFHDFHTEAFPSLQRHGFSATMYLPTAFIGTERKKFLARDCLTWGEVRELAQAGVEFGSHSVNHPMLVELTWPEIELELRDSKYTIEQQLGRTIPSFAYPFAYPQAATTFARQFRELLARTGYQSAVTTAIGRARPGGDPRQLSRLPVNSADDRPLFEAKLRGAYDWMALPQHSFKLLKQPFRNTPAAV